MDGKDVRMRAGEELRACRVCFATEARLFELCPGVLADMYVDLTGLPVFPTDGLPQHLCCICAALLKNAAAFKKRCRAAHELLQRSCRLYRVYKITKGIIQKLDKKKLELPYTSTSTLAIHITGCDQYEVKKKPQSYDGKLKIEKEHEPYELIDGSDESMLGDQSIEPQMIKEELFADKIIIKADPVSAKKLVKADPVSAKKPVLKRTRKAPKEENVKEYLNKLFTEARRTKDELNKFAEAYNFEIIKFTKDEQMQNLEARKLSLKYNNSNFSCNVCFKGFKTKSVYSSHMVLHDPSSGSFACDVCKFRFPTRKKLERHSLMHKTKFVCKECKRSFVTSSAARWHYHTHVGVSFECEHCGKKFSKYPSRVNHIRIHHGATACDICYAGFQSVNGVTQHKTKAHQKTYQCTTCAVHFDNENAVMCHLSQTPDGTCDPSVRACAKCGQRCVTEDIFNKHIAAHVAPKYNGKPNKKCCSCQHFESTENGDSEYSDTVGEYSVPAVSCPCANDVDTTCNCPMGSWRGCIGGTAAPVRRRPGKRTWTHKGCCKEKKQVVCEKCGDILANEESLKIHQRLHEEDQLQCPQCPKKFKIQKYLKLHVWRRHTAPRSHKCELCPKAFKSHAYWVRHQLVHTNKRRYRCEVCDKTFRAAHNMKIHARVHERVTEGQC